jgi:hypothetical protein
MKMNHVNFLKTLGPVAVIMVLISLSGCFKKDLEEFKQVNSIAYTAEWALPFIEDEVTLEDSIPTVPGYTTIRMSDTSNVKIPASKSKDTLESIIDHVDMRIRLENTFPASGIVQLYFVDSTNTIVDSLLNNSQKVIPLANPKLIKTINVSISKNRYLNISRKSDKMYLFYDITTNTTAGLTNKKLKINIGVKAKLSLDIDLKNNK